MEMADSEQILDQQLNQLDREAAAKISAHFRKRLEDRICEILDAPEGTIHPELLECRDAAKTLDLKDELSVLNSVFQEIGEQVVEAAIQGPQKKGREEQKLEDFLSTGKNLELLEKGLVYESRQYVIDSGIIDMHARDAAGKPASIELKARNYVSRDVAIQLMKYLNEREGDRVLFVAPKIKLDLFNALKQYFESGRLQYFRVRETDDGYEFEHVDENNIDKSMRPYIDWTPKSRPKNGPIKIPNLQRARGKEKTVEAPEAPEPIIQQEPTAQKEGQKPPFENRNTSEKDDADKTEETDNEWESFPFFYQVLLTTRHGLQNPEKYLYGIEIPEERKKNLDALLMPDSLKTILENYERCRDWQISDKDELRQRVGIPHIRKFLKTNEAVRLMRDSKALVRNSKIVHKELMKFNKIIEKADVSETEIGQFAQLEQEIEQTIHDFFDSESYRRLHALHSRVLKNARDNDSIQHVRSEIFDFSFHGLQLGAQLGITKLKRTRELALIDLELALSYLKFCPPLDFYIRNLQHTKQPIVLTIPESYDFILRDNELYKSILDNLKIKREEPLIYKVLKATRPELENPERYINGIQVTSSQKATLERLLMPKDLQDIMHAFEIHLPWHMMDIERKEFQQSQEWPTAFNKFKQSHLVTFVNQAEEYDKACEEFAKIISFMYNFLHTASESGISYEKTSEQFTKLQSGLSRAVSMLQEEAKYAQYMDILHHMAGSLQGNALRYVRSHICGHSFYLEQLIGTFFQTKLKRAESLAQFDPVLSFSYLCFNPVLEAQLRFGTAPEGVVLNITDQFAFIKNDNELYKSILDNLKIKREEKTETQQTETRIQTPKERLIEAITERQNGAHYSQDTRARISYFAEDAADMLPAEKVDGLCQEFAKMRLDRHFRKREEIPDDLKVRNFFDDVTLKYIRQGQVPTAEELEKVYEHA